jgi:hypothetical protein
VATLFGVWRGFRQDRRPRLERPGSVLERLYED